MTNKSKSKRDSFEAFAKLCRTNTGSAMCDSGTIYGYNYERPLPQENEPAVTVSMGVNSIQASLSLTHVLHAFLTSNETAELLQEEYDKYCEEHEDDSWLQTIEEFLESKEGVSHIETHNTYNWENDLDQVLQYTRFDYKDDYYIAIQPHCGCDVRGGYPKPQIYRISGDIDYWWSCLSTIQFWHHDYDNNCKYNDWDNSYQLNKDIDKAEETDTPFKIVLVKPKWKIYWNRKRLFETWYMPAQKRFYRSYEPDAGMRFLNKWLFNLSRKCSYKNPINTITYWLYRHGFNYPVLKKIQTDNIDRIICPCGSEIYWYSPTEY